MNRSYPMPLADALRSYFVDLGGRHHGRKPAASQPMTIPDACPCNLCRAAREERRRVVRRGR